MKRNILEIPHIKRRTQLTGGSIKRRTRSVTSVQVLAWRVEIFYNYFAFQCKFSIIIQSSEIRSHSNNSVSSFFITCVQDFPGFCRHFEKCPGFIPKLSLWSPYAYALSSVSL